MDSPQGALVVPGSAVHTRYFQQRYCLAVADIYGADQQRRILAVLDFQGLGDSRVARVKRGTATTGTRYHILGGITR